MMSAGFKKARESVNAAKEAVTKLGEGQQLTGAKAVKALANEKEHRKELQKEIKEQEKLISDLERKQSKAVGSKQWQDEARAIDKAKKELKAFNDALKDSEKDISELTTEVEKFEKKQNNIANVATGWNQASELAQKFADSMNFAQEYKDVEANIARMTQASGAALDESSAQVHRLSAIYGDEGNEVARAANAMSKNMGLSFNDALALMEKGYQKGANLNGDMLDQLKEYPAVLSDTGFSAEELMAKMAWGAQNGIFSDKLLDSLKEASLSIKEMDQAQVDALKGIGIVPADLKDKTVKQVVEMMGTAMDNASYTVQQKQKIIADVFRGAGEDAGAMLTQGLTSQTSLDSMPAIEQAGSWVKGFMADVQSFAAQTFGSVAISLQQLAPAFMAVSSGIGIIQSLSKMTWAQNIATKALTVVQRVFNIVMKANPIGLVITAVGLLIGGIMLLAQKFAWANGIVEAVKASWKQWGQVILDSVLFPIKQVVAALESIWLLLNGDWEAAWDKLKAPSMDAVSHVTEAIDATASGYKKGVDDHNARKAAEAAGVTDPNSAQSPTTLDGIVVPTAGGGGGGKGGGGGRGGGSDGLSVSGGGGTKNLTMNLTVNNTFSGIKSDFDIRDVADKVSGIIVDRLRDATISFG